MRTATIKLDSKVQLECNYYIERNEFDIFNIDIVVEEVYYNGVDVAPLINEIDVEFFRILEEKIKDRL